MSDLACFKADYHEVSDLLADLTARGVLIEAHGDKLRIEAPPGVLTADLRQALAARKAAILAHLAGAAQPTPPPEIIRIPLDANCPPGAWAAARGLRIVGGTPHGPDGPRLFLADMEGRSLKTPGKHERKIKSLHERTNDMGITVTRTKSEPIPAGLYAATIEDVAQETGKFGEQLKVKFLIEEEGFEGKVLIGWASLAFSPKSKLYGWVRCAVFGGRDVPDNYQTFDSDHLIGRRVFLSVTTEKGADGETFNKVKDLLPYRSSPAQPPKPAENAQPPAVTTRAASAAPSKPSDPPDWPDWDEASLRDPGPTDEDEV